jgi:DNA-binding CsgD family transcriptional regulator
MGANAFTERARREVHTTGEKVRRHRENLGAELFLSARTVEWQLRSIFTTLNITSRRELDAALNRRSHALATPTPHRSLA